MCPRASQANRPAAHVDGDGEEPDWLLPRRPALSRIRRSLAEVEREAAVPRGCVKSGSRWRSRTPNNLSAVSPLSPCPARVLMNLTDGQSGVTKNLGTPAINTRPAPRSSVPGPRRTHWPLPPRVRPPGSLRLRRASRAVEAHGMSAGWPLWMASAMAARVSPRPIGWRHDPVPRRHRPGRDGQRECTSDGRHGRAASWVHQFSFCSSLSCCSKRTHLRAGAHARQAEQVARIPGELKGGPVMRMGAPSVARERAHGTASVSARSRRKAVGPACEQDFVR